MVILLNEKEYNFSQKMTIFEFARENGVYIPNLCYHEALLPYGACRLCIVEIEEKGRSRVVPSCLFHIYDGLIIRTDTPKIKQARKIIAELLSARCPDVPAIKKIAEQLGVNEVRFEKENEDCILCGLCVRACREIVGVNAIGFSGRGIKRKVETPFSTNSPVCIECGTCELICPTEAIKVKDIAAIIPAD